ncbi:MAG: hypothetical protein M1290_03095 [Candidatus Thermoplasmatota archaeon]|jgi:hypothetical protein|nr:hypothetical protein [Candidatus Thermoplasmatota archaeon]MCL5789433.1 hypothetical protein [Candidatus Thermoplasmatota archaeon]
MISKWKIYVRDRENLRTLLNLLIVNREIELIVRKNEGLVIYASDNGTLGEIMKYVKEELGNKIENVYLDSEWRENIFLFNKPKYALDSVFPFLLETPLILLDGDILGVKVERYSTFNPLRRRQLGAKNGRVLYRVKLFSPVLVRDYSSRNGMQCLTFERRNPLILTAFELSSLINGGGRDGLLAL